MIYEDGPEDIFWKTADPDDLWVVDKLILSRKLGYQCGPTGMDVPKPGWYIVRPCVNALGLGMGAQKIWLEEYTVHLPYGFFWCEWFDGRHLSVDYKDGEQFLCVEGLKSNKTFTRWDKWTKVDDQVPLPKTLNSLADKYTYMNCEYIGNKLIEVHLRHNGDFENDISEFIPVWEDQKIDPPSGFKYIEYPDIHGRIGAYVK
jgi:hypothetical protein